MKKSAFNSYEEKFANPFLDEAFNAARNQKYARKIDGLVRGIEKGEASGDPISLIDRAEKHKNFAKTLARNAFGVKFGKNSDGKTVIIESDLIFGENGGSTEKEIAKTAMKFLHKVEFANEKEMRNFYETAKLAESSDDAPNNLKDWFLTSDERQQKYTDFAKNHSENTLITDPDYDLEEHELNLSEK
jgi:hypothetical protein